MRLMRAGECFFPAFALMICGNCDRQQESSPRAIGKIKPAHRETRPMVKFFGVPFANCSSSEGQGVANGPWPCLPLLKTAAGIRWVPEDVDYILHKAADDRVEPYGM
jgi:hypothetical protein